MTGNAILFIIEESGALSHPDAGTAFNTKKM